ncbi:hypothetical protein Lser_V15G22410 [Lactuca serriola]
MVVFDVVQFDGILKKLSEFNNALGSDPRTNRAYHSVSQKYQD